MVRVYCQKCVDEFKIDNYESHPKLCPKCQDVPCKTCGKPRKVSKTAFCSVSCRMKYHYDKYRESILAKKKEDYKKGLTNGRT